MLPPFEHVDEDAARRRAASAKRDEGRGGRSKPPTALEALAREPGVSFFIFIDKAPKISTTTPTATALSTESPMVDAALRSWELSACCCAFSAFAAAALSAAVMLLELVLAVLERETAENRVPTEPTSAVAVSVSRPAARPPAALARLSTSEAACFATAMLTAAVLPLPPVVLPFREALKMLVKACDEAVIASGVASVRAPLLRM
mmetsp:Transcript_41136/g.132340  ORF Transcript_41136/g.132340 Transcript_41136/m.132340 type:complete len:205 (-) Transcript_41136:2464-3078(-)